MNTRIPSRDNRCRYQWRKVLQPEAGAFRLSVPEHPRLNGLIICPSDLFYRVPVWGWIFDTDHRNRRIEQYAEEGCRLAHCLPPFRSVDLCQDTVPGRHAVQMTDASIGQVRAGWMGDHQIPPVTEQIEHISLHMRAGPISRQQVAGDRIVAGGNEGVPHATAVLAGDKDPHSDSACPSIILAVRRATASRATI